MVRYTNMLYLQTKVISTMNNLPNTLHPNYVQQLKNTNKTNVREEMVKYKTATKKINCFIIMKQNPQHKSIHTKDNNILNVYEDVQGLTVYTEQCHIYNI